MEFQLPKDGKQLMRKWFVLAVWFAIFLILMHSVGIVIHEYGHYGAGNMYGCANLSISIAKLSWQNSMSSVSGWTNCPVPLVVNENGGKICNTPTNIVAFAGIFITLLFFIPLLLVLNALCKKKIKWLYLEGRFFVLTGIFIISMAILSAIFDLFKIWGCLFNAASAEIVFKLISLIPTMLAVIILIFLIIDLKKAILINKYKRNYQKKKM